MEDDQQFCLRWNNHQSTLIQNFDTLLESGTLVDCTLAAEGKTLKAHKVVLSACSPYFECLLSEHYDKHPVFILKDVKFKELKAMMDYMYRGEVNISQDQLAALLKAAESLQIKGLSESKTAGSSKTESRPQKTVSQPTAPSLDIPHASSGLTIEKNKVPRQSLAQSSVGDIPEDTASPQVSKGLSSREGSQSPTSRKRKRPRRRSLTEDTIESQDASNSSDMPQQMGVPALGIAPVADEKVHADPTDSLGRSALMTQLTKPADEMLQLPLEKPEPNDNLIEPKSEYLEDAEEGVEDLTLDEDMNDLNDMEQDNNRAGPSHDPAQHPAGLGSWHVTGDRSNAGGVVGSVVAGAPGTTDEVFLQAQEAAQAHRDSQESSQEEETLLNEEIREEEENSLERKKNRFERSKGGDFVNGKLTTNTVRNFSASISQEHSKVPNILNSTIISINDSQSTEANDDDSHIIVIPLKQKEKSSEKEEDRSKRSEEDNFVIDEPTTSIARNSSANIGQECFEIISLNDSHSTEMSDNDSQIIKNPLKKKRSNEDDFDFGEPKTSTVRNIPLDIRRLRFKRSETISSNTDQTTKKPLKRKGKPEEEKRNRSERNRDVSVNDEPSTSSAQTSSVGTGRRRPEHSKTVSPNDDGSQSEDSDNESPWTNSKDAKVKPTFLCPHCSEVFYRPNLVTKHMQSTCLLNPVARTNQEDGRHKCSVCGCSFKAAKSLTYHQKHECQKWVKCPDCGLTMKGSSITKRHKESNCISNRRSRIGKSKKIKQENSADELFDDASSIDFSD